MIQYIIPYNHKINYDAFYLVLNKHTYLYWNSNIFIEIFLNIIEVPHFVKVRQSHLNVVDSK